MDDDYAAWVAAWNSDTHPLMVERDHVHGNVLNYIEQHESSFDRIVLTLEGIQQEHDNLIAERERLRERAKIVERFSPDRELNHQKQMLVCYVNKDSENRPTMNLTFSALSYDEQSNAEFNRPQFDVLHVLYIPGANVALLYIKSFLRSIYRFRRITPEVDLFSMNYRITLVNSNQTTQRIKGLLQFIANLRGGVLRTQGDADLFERPPPQRNRWPNTLLSYQYDANIDPTFNTAQRLTDFLYRPPHVWDMRVDNTFEQDN